MAVATRFAVSVESARQWLNGQSKPDTARLMEIASDFNCSLDWLLMGRLRSDGKLREVGASYDTLSPEERAVVDAMRRFSARRRAALVQFISDS